MFHQTFAVKNTANANKAQQSDSTNEMVTECLAVSHEAFALLVTGNELHLWEEQMQMEEKDESTRKQMRLEKRQTKGGHTTREDTKFGWSMGRRHEPLQPAAKRNQKGEEATPDDGDGTTSECT